MSTLQNQLLKTKISKASVLYESLRTTRPVTKADLKNYVKVFLGLDIPDVRICKDHCSPLDYLYHSFTLDFAKGFTAETAMNAKKKIHKYNSAISACSAVKNGDCIIWANRAGGKTELAAVATILDCIFKPNCKTNILAGSGEQAGRMYEYFLQFLKNGYDKFLTEPAKISGCSFKNNALVEVLTQSAASIRGRHIQKLRCDEVELFEEDLFNAAKFTTQSKDGLVGAMEIFSTMHKPYGLMQKLVADAQKNNAPIFKWCIWETIEKCIGRNCSQCPLFSDCQGKAKNAAGYIKIDDIITHSRRSSRSSFEAEMLCQKPSLENIVFDEFEPDIHVKEIGYDPNLPLYRSLDFGFINPFVCLWIQVDDNGIVRVIDEYLRHRATIHIHAENIKNKIPHPVEATFCDPAGKSPNDVTGTSAVRELKAVGIPTRYRKSSILEGIELIRRSLRSGDGKSTIIISPKCSRLIEALQCYHYPDSSDAPTELPLKDGVYDHPIDALRYFFVNHNCNKPITTRNY